MRAIPPCRPPSSGRIAALSAMVGPTLSAVTTKLSCRNVFPDGTTTDAGPMEIDLENSVVYRFNTRTVYRITSITDANINFIDAQDVGGQLSVLDVATGELHSAFVLRSTGGVIFSDKVGTQRCMKKLVE